MNIIEAISRVESLGSFSNQRGGRRQFFQDGFKLLFSQESVDCPIYFWHEVSANFPDFVISLMDKGGYPIAPSKLLNFLQTGEICWPEGNQPFVLTCDDGYLSQRNNALPFLSEWRIPAGFCVMPGWTGDGTRHRYMSDDNVREFSEAGMEAISHTVNHANLVSLRPRNPGAWAAEIVESKSRLEDIIGKNVDFLCYPFGAYDRQTVDLTTKYYKAALSTRPGSLQHSSEISALRRRRQS